MENRLGQQPDDRPDSRLAGRRRLDPTDPDGLLAAALVAARRVIGNRLSTEIEALPATRVRLFLCRNGRCVHTKACHPGSASALSGNCVDHVNLALSRIMALSFVRSFRATAMRATFAGFPAALSRL